MLQNYSDPSRLSKSVQDKLSRIIEPDDPAPANNYPRNNQHQSNLPDYLQNYQGSMSGGGGGYNKAAMDNLQ